MSNRVRIALLVVLSLCVAFALGTSLAVAQDGKQDSKKRGGKYQKNFPEEPYKNTGSNDYFILEPGYFLKLAGEDDGEQVELTITVCHQTELVDPEQTNNVFSRVVEEREEKDGKLFEVSRNFFLLGQETNNAYYFGEDVLFYDENGNVISTEGSWRSGINDAKYGMIMPADARVGQRYYQEIAPGVALDRAEHISLSADVETPAGKFRTLKVRETTPLEPKVEEFKFHAKGVGLVKDGPLKLTETGNNGTCAT